VIGPGVLRQYAADHHGIITDAAASAAGVRAVELLDSSWPASSPSSLATSTVTPTS
jgi:hypothetical protein